MELTGWTLRRAGSFFGSQSFLLCFAVFLLALTAPPSRASAQPQSAKSPAASQPTVPKNLLHRFHGPEGLIHLDVVVTDKTGKPVTGLGRDNFTLLDNGQKRNIISFRAYDGKSAKPYPPVEVVIAIDTLNLSGFLTSHVKGEIETYLRQNGGHLAQQVSVIALTVEGPRLIAGPSADGNALAAEMNMRGFGHRDGYPQSELVQPDLSWDRTPDQPSLAALTGLGRIATIARQRPGRKLLIWVGPGSGLGSGTDIVRTKQQQQLFDLVVWFSTLLRVARIDLYSASVGKVDVQQHLYRNYLKPAESVKQAQFGDLARDVLAVESGGGVPDPQNDLASEINSCVRESGAFYSLSFDPPQAQHLDEYHDLKVQVNQPDLTARTNTGYYDQPFYSYQGNPTARRVTVAQLDAILKGASTRKDGEIARQISNLKLTERLSGAKLSSILNRFHGKKTRRALVVLADMSAFLEPPPAEIPAQPPPSLAEQQQIISLAGKYLTKTIPLLPDFFAQRTMARYVETSNVDRENNTIDFRPLHLFDRSTAEVLYREGQEVVESKPKKGRKHPSQGPNLTTSGIFGPALELMRETIADPGSVTWLRWEQGIRGNRAVFGYTVPLTRSQYRILACCLPDGDGTTGFDKLAPYHGEISIDPATGAILRFQVQADLKQFPPILQSDIMVAYGPVEIGGKTYISPVRGVSIITMRSVKVDREGNEAFRTYGPYGTVLNDFTFDHYHMFRSSTRILMTKPSAP